MIEFFGQAQAWLPKMLDGLYLSMTVTFFSLLIGIPLGFALSLSVASRTRSIRWLSLVIVELGRGAPSLVLLQFAYFGLPSTGLTLSSFGASVLALSWTTCAYTSEIIRGALHAVPKGQYEASLAVGLNPVDTMRFIIVPQGLKVALPSLFGFSILIFQSTSLCFAIALPELISRAYEIGTNTFQYFPALVLAGLLYLMICAPATIIVGLLEARISKT